MSAADGPRWYVVQTHPHAEGKARWHLDRQGFETYLPRYLKKRRHARRVDSVIVPLFPRYLFVAIDMRTQRWLAIRSTIGVSRLVCDGERPAPVPISVYDALRRREDANGLVKLDPKPPFSAGEKICVVEGVFQDCLGVFEGMSSNERVTILLELLGRKVRVDLESELLVAV